MAIKCIGKNATLPEHKDVNIMDRGGSQKVNENVISISKIAECYFRIATQKHVVKIDCKSIASNETANDTTVLDHATVIKSKSEKPPRKKLL